MYGQIFIQNNYIMSGKNCITYFKLPLYIDEHIFLKSNMERKSAKKRKEKKKVGLYSLL